MPWPPIPARVYGAGGPIRVRLVKRASDDDGADCWGTWEPSHRVIRLAKGVPSEYRYRTLFHELCHAMLHDSGLAKLLTDAGEEAFCEAYATQRLAELRAVLGDQTAGRME